MNRNGDIDYFSEYQLINQIAMNPADPDAYLRLGDLLYRRGDMEGAVHVYRSALTTNISRGEIYHNLGNALLALRRFPEAIAAYSEVARLMPLFAECHVTAATALQSICLPVEALNECELALALDPGLPEAHWNRALLLLQLGAYQEGWQEFEWRWRKRGYTTKWREFEQPQWRGESLDWLTILVHSEQAFGDTIMFSRYLPLVAARGGRVICESPAPLVRLISSVNGVSAVVAAGIEPPGFDCHIPLLSLPLIFGTTLDTLPAPSQFPETDRQRLALWQERLIEYPGLRVGIAWAGRRFPDPARSCPFRLLAPLADLENVIFVSLQIDDGTEDLSPSAGILPLIDLTAGITDFADTAALVKCLDLVITIDSAVAHLAGTIGLPTWVMLPFAADWRWLLGRDDSPWYPAMRLFRQSEADGWSEVIERVRYSLSSELAKNFAASYEGLYERGMVALGNGDTAQSWFLFERARYLNPSVPESYNALALLATSEDNLAKAEELLLHAINLDPDFVDPLINLGNLMFETGRYQESAEMMLQAVELSPESPCGWQNLGVIFQGCGKISEAFRCFNRALCLDPEYATASWNLSNLELLTGDYESGWRNFEARFCKTNPVPLRHVDIPQWDGEPLREKSLLIYAEQGYGDTIQFVRYIPLIYRLGGRIIFECPDQSMFRLLESLPGIDTLIVRSNAKVSADFQIPLLSLPGILGTRLDTIPDGIPYLLALPERVAKWSRVISAEKVLQVGLCWSGRQKPDPRRSCSLKQMAPLASVYGVRFHSLQLGAGAEEASFPPDGMHLSDSTGELSDFAETAALISNLDLVITIDTVVAHLAGALGKPVWLMLPFAPDWRWLLDRVDSPWYSSMRLFRQNRPGVWDDVMMRIAAELDTTAATYHGRQLQDFA